MCEELLGFSWHRLWAEIQSLPLRFCAIVLLRLCALLFKGGGLSWSWLALCMASHWDALQWRNAFLCSHELESLFFWFCLFSGIYVFFAPLTLQFLLLLLACISYPLLSLDSFDPLSFRYRITRRCSKNGHCLFFPSLLLRKGINVNLHWHLRSDAGGRGEGTVFTFR